MFLLLPLIGGLLAGWLAPQRTAIAVGVAFTAIAATIVTISAPSHGAGYDVAIWVIPLAVILSIAGLSLGFRVRRHRLTP